MPLRVFTNVPSINVQRIGHINNRQLATRLERLSTGLKINRAADDAAGLSISEGMRAEVSGLRQGADFRARHQPDPDGRGGAE
jgi:flagellin